MNSTELSIEFQSAVALAHHICGSTLAAFNAFVCLLILIDSDPRGKSYRKYLFPLQLFSTLADLFMDWYSPYFHLNALVIYANSWIASFLDIPAAFMIYMCLFGQVCFSYFCCVFYRRNAILPSGSRFCYHGWKFVAVIGIVQTNLIIALCFLYYFISRFATPDSVLFPSYSVLNCLVECLPNTLHWVRYKAAYVIYQSRAVRSLVMQGTIPSLFFVIPVGCEIALAVYGIAVGAEAGAQNQQFSMLSVIGVNVLSLHAFAHSLTILAFSPSYRKTIQSWARCTSTTSGRVENQSMGGKNSAAQTVGLHDARRSIAVVYK